MSNKTLTDIVGGRPLVSCPAVYSNDTATVSTLGLAFTWTPNDEAIFNNPAITITFIVQAALALIFAFTIAIRWNRLKLFGRVIKSPYLSNHLWLLLFTVWCCESVVNATRYLLNLPYSLSRSSGSQDEDSSIYYQNIDTGLLIGSVVLHALSLLFICLSLSWERKHRIGVLPAAKDFLFRSVRRDSYSTAESAQGREEDEDDNDGSSTSLLSPEPRNSSDQILPANIQSRSSRRKSSCHWLCMEKHRRRYIFSFERLSLLVFFLNLGALYLNITPLPAKEWFFWIYIGSFGLFQLLIILLAARVLFSPTSPPSSSTARILSLSGTSHPPVSRREGPTRLSKAYLFLAVLFGVSFILPHNLMSRILYAIAGQKLPTNVGIELYDDLLTTSSVLVMPTLHKSDVIECIPFLFDGHVSYLDLIQWVGTLSMIFLILFVKEEYCRVKERCVWVTVTQVQDTFGFGQASSYNTISPQNRFAVPPPSQHNQYQ